MELRLKVFLTALAVAVLSAALLVPIAGASGSGANDGAGSMMSDSSYGMMGAGDGWCGGGMWDGSGSWGGTGMWGTGFGAQWLGNHPDAFDAWITLRTDHMTELRAWYDLYKGDLTSSLAQQALKALWQDHWDDMKAFYQQYADGTDWVCPALTMWGGMGGGMMGGGWTMWGTGYGTGWLLTHATAFDRWQTLRAKQMSQVSTWWTTYRAQPFSTAAQSALTAMRSRHRTQDLTYMSNHHITSGSAWSYRGWMGLGGTWGGWGW
jgi:hypothetical protein